MSLDSYIYRERARPEGAPLLLTFHGTGGDENQFFALAEELAPGAAIVSPRGDVLEHGSARFFRRKAEGVYDMDDLALRTEKMAAFVEGQRDRLKPSRLSALGYSNGANILTAVALARPQLFDDIVLMHPLIPWRPQPDPRLGKLRALVTAGRNDPICPPQLTTALAQFFSENAGRAALEWHSGGHELRPNEIAAARRFLAEEDRRPG